jgi:hypothetical protein
MDHVIYTSFLVRLWRADMADDGWHGQIEHIQSGMCREFDSLEAVLHFLHCATEQMLVKQAETTTQPKDHAVSPKIAHNPITQPAIGAQAQSSKENI